MLRWWWILWLHDPSSLRLTQTFSAVPHSLQLRSSDWSSQSASPSQRQPALMHRPLSHMNSPERQGWWEAVGKHSKPLSLASLCIGSRSRPESHSPSVRVPPSLLKRIQGIQRVPPPPLCSCPSWHLCLANPARPPPFLHPAGESTHSSQTRRTSLRSHHRHRSGKCRGCSGRRHTGILPGCRGVLALLRLEGRKAGVGRGVHSGPGRGGGRMCRQSAFLK